MGFGIHDGNAGDGEAFASREDPTRQGEQECERGENGEVELHGMPMVAVGRERGWDGWDNWDGARFHARGFPDLLVMSS